MTTARTALVTGATRGIGLAIAHSLRDAGYRVVVANRSGVSEDGFDAVAMDIATTESVNAGFDAAEQLLGSPVEVLVANAGITKDQLLMRMSDDELMDVVNVNLAGSIRCARRASKGMMRLKKGRMIFVGSVVGLYGSAGQVNYSATKSGLVGVARSISRELGSRGITANVVAPGFIETAMTAELGDDLRAKYVAAIPAARFGAVDDIAAAVRFLASEEAAYITGAVIPVDGGLGMGH